MKSLTRTETEQVNGGILLGLLPLMAYCSATAYFAHLYGRVPLMGVVTIASSAVGTMMGYLNADPDHSDIAMAIGGAAGGKLGRKFVEAYSP